MITEDNIRSIFTLKSFQRGKQYWKKNLVEDISIVTDKNRYSISAMVSGSTFYHTEIQIVYPLNENGGWRFTGKCTCPVGRKCKHMVAVALTFLESNKAQEIKQASKPKLISNNPKPRKTTVAKPVKKASNPPNPALAPDMMNWLKNLNTAKKPNKKSLESAEKILYIIDQEQHPIGMKLKISLKHARWLSRGAYGKAYPLRRRDLACVTADDKAIIHNLDNADNRYNHQTCEEYLFAATQLPMDTWLMLLDSQRCYWQDNLDKPLSACDPRDTQAEWVFDEQGQQQLMFNVEGQADAVLPLSPPWYVDVEQNCSGALNTGLDDAIASALLNVPKISPEQVEPMRAQLQTQIPDLPLPQEIEHVYIKDVRPTYHLSLFNQIFIEQEQPVYRWYQNEEKDPIEVPLVRLSFDYDGQLIDGYDPAEQTSFDVDKRQFIHLKRRAHLETKARNRLKTLGFKRLRKHKGLDDYQIETENSNDLCLYFSGDDDNHRTEQALLQFNLYEVPKLREEGWQIDVDPEYIYQMVDPELLEDWYADLDDSTGMDWFGLEIGITIDGEKTNLLPLLVELLQGMDSVDDLQQFKDMPDDTLLSLRLDDGRIVPMPISRVRHILEALIELLDKEPLDEEGRLRLMNLKAAQLIDLEKAMGAARLRWHGGEKLLALGRKLKDFTGITEISPPKNLNVDLRAYQQEGLNWLQFLREYNLAGILADDMGLGKTVQSLAHILVEKQQGRLEHPCLVVAPTSLMANWKNEAHKFTPDLTVLILQGADRKQHFDNIQDYDIVLSTYPLLSRDENVLLKQKFHLLILDEAQNIKNPKAKATQVVHQLKATHRLCLTGTPMENHLGELWSLFHFLMPGFLGELQQFRELYRNPIEKEFDQGRRKVLSRRITPFLLRRTKQEVATELPEKTEIIRTVQLEGQQRDLYETIRLTMHEKVLEQVNNKGFSRSHIIILDALLKLRQVCCDPRLLKLDSAKYVKKSAKLTLLMEMLPEMIEEGRKVLLFSQFTSMLALIAEACDKQGIKYTQLTGKTRKRAEVIETFQNGDVPLFLISLKAGGIGLNLTAADTVIHYDPWWNPAVENQATDRAHRIGQDKKVFVYKLLTEGTVEEKILELQNRKKLLSDAMLSGKSMQKGSQLSSEDLSALFEPL